MSVNNPQSTQTEAARLSENPNDERLTAALTKVTEVARQTQSYAYQFFRTGDGTLLEVRALHDRETWFFTEVDQMGKPTAPSVEHGDGSPIAPPPQPERIQVPQSELDTPETPPKHHWWSNRKVF